MNRPEPNELQLALLISKIDSPTASAAAKLLALEVLALQADRAWCGTNHGNNMCPVGLQKVRELQATIARVEALPEKWRADYEASGHDYELSSCLSCADELNVALEGPQ